VFLADAIDPVEAAALEALLVRRGTGSAVRDDGLNTADIQHIDDAFESTLKAEIAYAWRRLIQSRQLEIVSLVIRTEDVSAVVDIRIRNLTRRAGDQFRTVTVPLLALQGAL
jgi:hypothetical protein